MTGPTITNQKLMATHGHPPLAVQGTDQGIGVPVAGGIDQGGTAGFERCNGSGAEIAHGVILGSAGQQGASAQLLNEGHQSFRTYQVLKPGRVMR